MNSWNLKKCTGRDALTSMVFLPCVDSGFEWAIGVMGKDDVLFILDENNFVKDKFLDILTFPLISDGEPPRARIAAFSISEVLFLNLKLNLGMRLLMDDLPLDEGLDTDSLYLA